MLLPCSINIRRTCCPTLRIHFYSLHPRSRDQLHTQFKIDRPVTTICRCLCSLGTTPQTGRTLYARLEPSMCPCGNRVGTRPPVPTQLIMRFDHSSPNATKRCRRQERRGTLRIRSI